MLQTQQCQQVNTIKAASSRILNIDMLSLEWIDGERRIGIPRCILSCRIDTYQPTAERYTSTTWSHVPD